MIVPYVRTMNTQRRRSRSESRQDFWSPPIPRPLSSFAKSGSCVPFWGIPFTCLHVPFSWFSSISGQDSEKKSRQIFG
jgi:hypothetical protein